jgi:spore germination protein YaaH
MIERKVEIVKKYKVAGIGIWRLGGEDSKNWETIEKLLK